MTAFILPRGRHRRAWWTATKVQLLVLLVAAAGLAIGGAT